MFNEKEITYLRNSFQIFNLKKIEVFLKNFIEKRKKIQIQIKKRIGKLIRIGS